METKINPITTKLLRAKLRRDATLPERLLWNQLRQKQFGYKFRRQYGIGPFIADFCCPKARLVIEIDGEIHGYQAQRNKDQARESYLVNNGFKLIRYQAREVLNNIEGVCEDIKNKLR